DASQSNSVVVRLIVSGVEQGHNAVAGSRAQRSYRFALTGKFGGVAPAKPQPPRGLVIIPGAKPITWRQIAEPTIDGCRLLVEPTGPQPIDEDALAVACVGRFVNALCPHMRCWNSGAHGVVSSAPDLACCAAWTPSPSAKAASARGRTIVK